MCTIFVSLFLCVSLYLECLLGEGKIQTQKNKDTKKVIKLRVSFYEVRIFFCKLHLYNLRKVTQENKKQKTFTLPNFPFGTIALQQVLSAKNSLR